MKEDVNFLRDVINGRPNDVKPHQIPYVTITKTFKTKLDVIEFWGFSMNNEYLYVY